MPVSVSPPSDPITLTVDIVATFVAHHSVPVAELPALIRSVHAALSQIAGGSITPSAAKPVAPAVSVSKSITPDYIICLDDGRRFKSLRRHLANLGMTPDEYRAKWNLPADYPMVAANYSARRSDIATRIGLGAHGRRAGKRKLEEPAQAKGETADL